MRAPESTSRVACDQRLGRRASHPRQPWHQSRAAPEQTGHCRARTRSWWRCRRLAAQRRSPAPGGTSRRAERQKRRAGARDSGASERQTAGGGLGERWGADSPGSYEQRAKRPRPAHALARCLSFARPTDPRPSPPPAVCPSRPSPAQGRDSSFTSTPRGGHFYFVQPRTFLFHCDSISFMAVLIGQSAHPTDSCTTHCRTAPHHRSTRIPRACRNGFSSKWVGSTSTIRNITSATTRPAISSQ